MQHALTVLLKEKYTLEIITKKITNGASTKPTKLLHGQYVNNSGKIPTTVYYKD